MLHLLEYSFVYNAQDRALHTDPSWKSGFLLLLHVAVSHLTRSVWMAADMANAAKCGPYTRIDQDGRQHCELDREENRKDKQVIEGR